MIPTLHSAPVKQKKPFGSWPSPIGVEEVISGSNRMGGLTLAGKRLLWTESRPADQGRQALCGRDWDAPVGQVASTLLASPWNLRNRVHEYGGGALTAHDHTVWFCHDGDGAIYEWRGNADPSAQQSPELLFALQGCRFADLTAFPHANVLLAVCEDHQDPKAKEPKNYVIAITLVGQQRGQYQIIAQGHDFFSNPCPSPDGRSIAWMSWDHPNMPWDSSSLWCADWSAEGISKVRHIAGGADESVFQPSWSPDGRLHFVSDRSGWWNLYAVGEDDLLINFCPMEAEFATPQWEFGMRTYGFQANGEIVAVIRSGGYAQIGTIPAAGGTFSPIDLPWKEFRALQVGHGKAWCFAGSPSHSECLVEIDLHTKASMPLGGMAHSPFQALLSSPEAMVCAGSGGEATHAFFYRPHHPEFEGEEGQHPPVIVMNHGGPTSACSSTLKLAIQFWTSRGFALLDMNYGGSSGFGRAYRARLEGNWGVVDVEDAVQAVAYLAQKGEIDGRRAAIRGSSAGGYTTLAAMTFHHTFKVGVSLYGIGDLGLLASDTHKFESRYLDRLVAPWPEGKAIYEARSPLSHIDQLQGALLILQGAEDKVVPPNQAESMYQAAKQKGLPVSYILFPGEQHGFRKAETMRAALSAELFFYGKLFGFEPADRVAPIPIDNF